jgi:rhodanese-related sulfurtransferase
MNHFKYIFLTLCALIITACGSTATSQPEAEVVGKKVSIDDGFYTDVSVTELQTMLADKNFTFVNVHIPFEGDIPGTDVSIPYDQIDQNLDKLPPDKNAPIVLYCRSDNMSTTASKTLIGLGYTNIWNLDGGMVAWEKAGLPIER